MPGQVPANFHLFENASGAPYLILLSNRENAMTALLDLIPAVRTGIKFPGGSYKSERHFLDFAIDGQSLWEKLKKPDMVSVLCFEYAAQALDESMKAANRLLLAEKADHPHDRRSLFICSECGDLPNRQRGRRGCLERVRFSNQLRGQRQPLCWDWSVQL